MMRRIPWLSCILVAAGCARSVDHPEIRAVLDKQVAAWNHGDLEGFMAGYWKSEQTTFSTPDSTAHGWQATFDRYKKRYADPTRMGRVTFEAVAVTPTGPNSALVHGRYVHRLPDGVKTGRFDLTFRRINGAWLIVEDHTTPTP